MKVLRLHQFSLILLHHRIFKELGFLTDLKSLLQVETQIKLMVLKEMQITASFLQFSYLMPLQEL